MADPQITQYTVHAPPGWEHDSINVMWTGRTIRGRFDTTADVWAIRKGGRVLARDGQWEWEPLPSSRDADFLARCRWKLDEALPAAVAAMHADNAHRDEWLREREAETAGATPSSDSGGES